MKKTEGKSITQSGNASITLRDMFTVICLILVTLTALLFIMLNFNLGDSNVSIADRYANISEDWELQIGDRKEKVDFPVNVDAKDGEEIVFSKELPKIFPYYALVTRNYHQVLKVEVDGENIYQFPSEGPLLDRPGFITDDWNIIRLDESMSGGTIKIRLTTGRFGFKGVINPFYMGEDNSVIHYIRAKAALPYGMAVSVLTQGIILIILGIIYSKYNKDRSQTIAGLMLVSIGLWVTNRSKMPILLVGSSIKYYLAFLGLMVEALLIMLYVGEKFKDKNKKMTSYITGGLAIYLLLTVGIICLLKYPLDRAVPFAYGAIFLSSVYLIKMLWPTSFGAQSKDLSSFEQNANKIEFVATNCMVIGVCLGIVFDFIVGNDRMWTDIGALPKISLNIYAIGQLIVHIYRGYHGVEEREELQGRLHDSQLELMMGQIQPHFIFNTLSSIRTLVKVDPDTAYDMIYDFSNYLRANVDNVTNLEGISFASELEHIKSYVNIEKVRFGDRLKVNYDVRVTDFIVPPLSIQPMIENSIKHGVTKKAEGGTVWLRTYLEGEYNMIEVEDNGVGMTPERLEEIRMSLTQGDDYAYAEHSSKHVALTGNGSEEHKSSGMRNIYMRLREISNADFEISSVEGEGTKIRVKVPIKGIEELR